MKRAVLLAATVALAVLVAWWSPAPWSAGPGHLVVGIGQEEVRTPLVVGARTPVVLEVPGAVVRLPAGVPREGIVRATVEPVGGRAPALDAFRIELELADGRRARLPGVRWDAADGVLEASRRAPARVGLALGLLALVAVLWVSELVPLFVTSLLVPIVLVVARAEKAPEALAPFFHPILALFFGGFLMAEAMRRVGLDRRLALWLVARAGQSPVRLFAALLGVAAFASMWMSNTAATALLIPIALAITEPIGHAGYRKAVVLGIAYAATTGGVGSAIGTPGNLLAIEMLDTFAGQSISFAGWFAYGLPMVLLFLPLMGFVLWRRSGVRVAPEAFAAVRARATEALRETGPVTRGQRIVLGVFVAIMGCWLTETWHGVDPGIVALGGVVALSLLGQLGVDDLGRISWGSLLTFGGGLALGRFLVASGASDQLAMALGGLAGLPSFVGVAAVAALALALTTFASNTATAAMLIPLALPLAGVLGMDPRLLVIVVAIASSIDYAVVIGTPPTMIAFATRLYTAREIFRTGILLDVLGLVVLLTAVVGLWHLLGIL